METQNEQSFTAAPEAKANLTDEVKNFYKGDFKEIFMTFFKNPIDGIFSIFQKPSEKTYTHSIILYASVFILYLLGTYILVGESRRYIEFGNLIKISLVPVVMMFLITVLSFGIKSMFGKANFKGELLTGGLCGIPLGLLIPVLLVIKLMATRSNIESLVRNPAEAGVIGIFLLFYLILMLINVFQQSLKASGTKDAVAWYLSPASILLSIYFTFEISKGLF